MLNHSIFNITGSIEKYVSARAENLAINAGRGEKRGFVHRKHFTCTNLRQIFFNSSILKV